MPSVMSSEQYRRNGIRGSDPAAPVMRRSGPRSEGIYPDGGFLITTPEELEAALRGQFSGMNGIAVTPDTAMRVAAVYGCVRLLSGPPATLPFQVKRRIDERIRVDASDSRIWQVLNRQPNKWQTPAVFKRMMTAHVLLRGNAYALKVGAFRGGVQALIPLHPDRVLVTQNDDLSVTYLWSRFNGQTIPIPREDMLHLMVLSLDGIRGVSPLTFARETIANSLGADRYISKITGNGARVAGFLKSPNQLSDPAYDRLKESLQTYRTGGDREGEIMLLEEGLEYDKIGMTPEDLQWIEARKLSRSEIAMFYGVPPSMIGDNSGSDSNWGTGLEQKVNGYIAFTQEDYLTMWEEGVNLGCVDSPDLYARYNRAALVKGDIDKRWSAYVRGLQWGVYSPNEVRALEDMNPRDGGDIYYPPPNTAGDAGASPKDGNNDQNPAKD